MDKPLRYGVLEVVKIVDDKIYLKCLVHPNDRPFILTLAEVEEIEPVRCYTCAADAAELRPNAIDRTGTRYNEWIAMYSAGLSAKAALIRENQRKWRDRGAILNQNAFNNTKYWMCYCANCHTERRIRVDKLENPPRCKCQRGQL